MSKCVIIIPTFAFKIFTIMSFEDKGLFLSFISYPFLIDGKDLYTNTLKKSFINHKKKLKVFDPSGVQDDYLYCPAGYRMFGSQGLVVLSLVDDYMFFHRYFNKNHLQSLLKESWGKESFNTTFDYNSVIVSGITEDEEETLEQKARNSFLLSQKRYPYIGIIRIKIDQRVLCGKGCGIETLKKIKEQINQLAEKHQKKRGGCQAKHITMECFNNDELTTVAFSDSLLFLFDFFGEIRGIKNTDERIQQTYRTRSSCGDDQEHVKHMFGTTFMSFGYDVDYIFNKEDEENKSIEIANKSFICAKTDELNFLKINCVIETKPGHCDAFFDYLNEGKYKKRDEKSLEIDLIAKNISGGCSIIIGMPLRNISRLEKLCLVDKVFERDVRKIKVSIKSVEVMEKCNVDENHNPPALQGNSPINETYVLGIKGKMKEIGVSKMLRDRILALFELYNTAYKDVLQRFFLKEILPTLLDYRVMLDEMSEDGCSIKELEDSLNEEITNMENACYDRLHSDKQSMTPLEYSGGIQQHLTAFDYSYKTIYKTFGCVDDPKSYVTITGAQRAASERTIFMLNINDVVYPELFITAVWKEVANFAIQLLLDDYDSSVFNNGYEEHVRKLFSGWSKFLQDEESFKILRYNLTQSESFLSADKTYCIIQSFISNELLQYFFKDFIVFHFAFQCDLKMMWYYYFKTLLQTTTCYHHLNEIDPKYLIHTLLRLFMVGLLSGKKEDLVFIEEQASNPFDNLLASDWIECYAKTWDASQTMFKTLQAYDFEGINRALIYVNELNIVGEYYNGDREEESFERWLKKRLGVNDDNDKAIKDKIIVEEGVRKRMQAIGYMEDKFKQGELIICDENLSETDFIISLFYAYMKCLYGLVQPDKVIKSIPRNKDGLVLDNLKIENVLTKSELYDNMSAVLSDVTGGFFVPSASMRKKYFQLKTTLYRSLWNQRYTHTTSTEL